MKWVPVCVIVLLCAVSGDSRPQGLFGGLLPAAKPQGDSPPKGPLAIFTQGQQAAQNAIGGFVSSLSETREKIRNETKKRIQALLNATTGNKGDPATPEKPEEAAKPEGEKEGLPETPDQSLDNKKKEDQKPQDSDKLGPEEKPTESNDHKEEESSSAKPQPQKSVQNKQKESVDNVSTEPPKKEGTPENTTPSKSTTEDIDVDKMIEEVFSTDPPKKPMEEEKLELETTTPPASEEETSSTEPPKGENEKGGLLQSILAVFSDSPKKEEKEKETKQ